jgi:imidazoleglycerol-phosphate dehydratase
MAGIMSKTGKRIGQIERKTRETHIRLNLVVDGQGRAGINTGLGFFDHMLTLFAVHSQFDLEVQAVGDLDVDGHHTVEDVGLCLGMALDQALADRAGICRYGHAYVPMDETLARVCVDYSNRPYLHYAVPLAESKVGAFDTQLVKEFARAFSTQAKMTLHIDLLHGENTHHILEAVFKALGRALASAAAFHPTVTGQLSSKGSL